MVTKLACDCAIVKGMREHLELALFRGTPTPFQRKAHQLQGVGKSNEKGLRWIKRHGNNLVTGSGFS